MDRFWSVDIYRNHVYVVFLSVSVTPKVTSWIDWWNIYLVCYISCLATLSLSFFFFYFFVQRFRLQYLARWHWHYSISIFRTVHVLWVVDWPFCSFPLKSEINVFPLLFFWISLSSFHCFFFFSNEDFYTFLLCLLENRLMLIATLAISWKHKGWFKK